MPAGVHRLTGLGGASDVGDRVVPGVVHDREADEPDGEARHEEPVAVELAVDVERGQGHREDDHDDGEEGAEPPAFGLCSPLLLTRAGVKMGKSERGAVFLDPALTSPWELYQYWLNDEDELVVAACRETLA